MLNRTKAPATSATILPEISYAMPVKSNGLETTFLPLKEEVCRVDLVFNCGTLHQHKKALANGVKELLFSGTDAYTENQILTYLDSHGAYYGCDVDFNFFTISLYSTPQLVSEVFENDSNTSPITWSARCPSSVKMISSASGVSGEVFGS